MLPRASSELLFLPSAIGELLFLPYAIGESRSASRCFCLMLA
jgi:hypothetical protein